MHFLTQIGEQLRHANGLAGHLVGEVMNIINQKPNRLAVDALRVGVSDTVLALGLESRHAIALMASRASRGVVYGIDQSEAKLERAQRENRLAIEQGRVVLYRGTFAGLPFADASIDKILAVNVVHSWKNPLAVAKEIRRVLRPEGSLSIYLMNTATMMDWRFAGQDTYRLLRATELSDLLSLGGFERKRICVSNIRAAGRGEGLLVAVSPSVQARGYLLL